MMNCFQVMLGKTIVFLFIPEILYKLQTMSTNIDKKVSEVIVKMDEQFQSDKAFKSIEQANILYEEMVKMGLIKKKGYNLASIVDIHLNTPVFNVVSSTSKNNIIQSI